LAEKSHSTTFVNANIIPMDTECVLENQTVIVENDRIKNIGPTDEVPIPEATEIIMSDGAYLMPGLADMHMHITSIGRTFDGPNQLWLYLAEGVTSIRNLSALPEHLDWQDAVVRGNQMGPTIYNGRLVAGLPTELQSMRYIFRVFFILLPVLIGLILWLLVWAGLKLFGDIAQFYEIAFYILPSLVGFLLIGFLVAWIKIIPLNFYVSRKFPFAMVPETPTEARRFVRVIKENGYDFVKVYDWMSRECYLAAMDEARRQKIYAIGHLLDELTLNAIYEGGLQEVAHMDEFIDSHLIGETSPGKGFNEVDFNYETISQSASKTKANQVMVVSNMVADETIYKLLEDPEAGLAQSEYTVVPVAVLEIWKTQGRLVNWQGQQSWRRNVLQPFLLTMSKALHDAGVPLLIGTDMTVEGMLPSHIHRELEILVEAGLTPFEALEAGTKNAAISVERMGRNGNFGTVEIGQRADLILIKENPLENVSHTRNRIGVMARGQWFPQAKLDGLVDDYVASFNQSTSTE
jgi:hypothetical protein